MYRSRKFHCQIVQTLSLKDFYVNILRNYHKHFYMPPCWILNFQKFQIFNGRKCQDDQSASQCQILCRSIKLLVRYGDFFTFKIAAILDF